MTPRRILVARLVSPDRKLYIVADKALVAASTPLPSSAASKSRVPPYISASWAAVERGARSGAAAHAFSKQQPMLLSLLFVQLSPSSQCLRIVLVVSWLSCSRLFLCTFLAGVGCHEWRELTVRPGFEPQAC